MDIDDGSSMTVYDEMDCGMNLPLISIDASLISEPLGIMMEEH